MRLALVARIDQDNAHMPPRPIMHACLHERKQAGGHVQTRCLPTRLLLQCLVGTACKAGLAPYAGKCVHSSRGLPRAPCAATMSCERVLSSHTATTF